MPHCNIPSKAQGRCLSKCSGPNRTSGQNDREARLAILRSTCRRFATLEQTAICQKTKLSHCKDSPQSNVKPLRANSLPTASIQTQNFENRFADYFPRLLHHICRADSLSLRQWGAQGDNGRDRESSQASKSPLTPLPRGFCGEALPHEDLSAIPRSNPLNEGTLLTGYGWGSPATRASAEPGE